MTPEEIAAEIKTLRERSHSLASAMQKHDNTLTEHKGWIEGLMQQMEAVQRLPRELVESASNLLRLQFSSELNLVKLQLTSDIKRVEEALKPIQKGITGIVWLVLTTVVLAALALVLKR